MRTVYIADDETEFDTLEECQEYEKELNSYIMNLVNGVHAYDRLGNPIRFEDYDAGDLGNAFEDIYFFTCDNDKAICAFLDKAHYFGCPCLEYGLNEPLKVNNRYFYDDKKNEWACFEDKMEALSKIANIFTKQRR